MLSDTFDTHPERPFTMKSGDTREVALYNRVAAINRINYLVQQHIPGYDLRNKTQRYQFEVDTRMWDRHYSKEPTAQKIDEQFCQWSAEVCLGLEGVKDDCGQK